MSEGFGVTILMEKLCTTGYSLPSSVQYFAKRVRDLVAVDADQASRHQLSNPPVHFPALA